MACARTGVCPEGPRRASCSSRRSLARDVSTRACVHLGDVVDGRAPWYEPSLCVRCPQRQAVSRAKGYRNGDGFCIAVSKGEWSALGCRTGGHPFVAARGLGWSMALRGRAARRIGVLRPGALSMASASSCKAVASLVVAITWRAHSGAMGGCKLRKTASASTMQAGMRRTLRAYTYTRIVVICRRTPSGPFSRA